jgi:hypothetical protein
MTGERERREPNYWTRADKFYAVCAQAKRDGRYRLTLIVTLTPGYIGLHK